MMKIRFFLALIVTVLLAGCAVQPADTYDPTSYSNQRILNEIKTPDMKISVGAFQDPSHVKKLVCLGDQYVTLLPKETFAHYIQDAVVEELKTAKIYDKKSPKKLSGVLDEVSFQGGAEEQTSWTIRMTFFDEHHHSFSIETHFLFAADSAGNPRFCMHVTTAFPSAAQRFVRDLFSDPQFQKFATGK